MTMKQSRHPLRLLRAAAEEMRRPKEGRSDIEKGVLPPFKADPNASAPQPPPLGREHDEVVAMADAIASHKLMRTWSPS